MKLLQWNILYKEVPKNILDTLQTINADIVCLQELTTGFAQHGGMDVPKYLAGGIGFNYFYKEAQIEGSETFGNAIFSRFPIVKTNFVFIQMPKEKPANYSDEGRLYVEVETEGYTIGTVHMSYTHQFVMTPPKESETGELMKVVVQKKTHYLIAGDFNALPNSYTINEMAKHLKNAGPDFNQKTWTTKPFSYQGFEASTLDWRLDYVFATPDIEVKSAEILDTPTLITSRSWSSFE